MRVISTDVSDLRNEFRYRQKAVAKLVMLGYFWDLDAEDLMTKTKFHAICELGLDDLETMYDQNQSRVTVVLYRVQRDCDDFVEVPIRVTHLVDVIAN